LAMHIIVLSNLFFRHAYYWYFAMETLTPHMGACTK
jgi:hypothetical protein